MIFGGSFSSLAFETIKLNETELTVYGFLRNNTGMFTGTQEFTKNGNQLATERTWLRVYGDYKISNQFRLWTTGQLVYEPWYPIEEGSISKKNGREYSEYNNMNDVLREAYVEYKPNKSNNVRLGRQIAIWGEALTSRVGDVIHPDDGRWGFAFANLEDTRIPQYMARGIHEITPLSSSFEWIINPPVVSNEYLVSRYGAYYNQNNMGEMEQRFGFHPEDRSYLFPYSAWPIGSSFRQVAPGVWAPIEIPNVRVRYPNEMSDTRYGFRTNTLALGMQFGFSYWHTQTYTPVVERGALLPARPPIPLPTREYMVSYPNIDIFGFSMNKQLPAGVVRSEVAYTPNMAFNTFNMGPTENGVVRRDNVKYMVAYDLTGYFYPSWHKTASFDISLEHVGEWTPNAKDLQLAYFATEYKKYHAAFNGRVSTNWLYNKLATEVIAGYDTWGDTFLVIPSVTYKPARFNDNLSINLKYIGIISRSDYVPLGFLRGKDMVMLTTEYNF
jgi:hypothetical protein